MDERPAFNLGLDLTQFFPGLVLRGSGLHALAVSLPVLVIAVYDVSSAPLRDASHKPTILSGKTPEGFSSPMSEAPQASPHEESSGIVLRSFLP